MIPDSYPVHNDCDLPVELCVCQDAMVKFVNGVYVDRGKNPERWENLILIEGQWEDADDDNLVKYRHVYPVNDKRPHRLDKDGSDCFCDPHLEMLDDWETILVTHKALDERL